jgi:tyrosyl-tRNA synthetase
MNLFDEFQWRGMVYDATDGAQDMLAKERVTCTSAFDPTASSLHVGIVLPIMALARLQRFGHSPIALVGGGTGMIGDPSGKSQERTLLSIETSMQTRAACARSSSASSTSRPRPMPRASMNNADWLRTVGLLEFLRDTGKHFTVNYMLAKESVKPSSRGDEGISFTEFSYCCCSRTTTRAPRHGGCTLQMGGSDQWGNIVAGCDLIRKVAAPGAHGLVLPLVTTSSGTQVRQDGSRHGVARSGENEPSAIFTVLAADRWIAT